MSEASLPAVPTTPATGWHARLELGFECRGDTTVLARRQHEGPLRVQKALYPEGPSTCHVIVLHPPSGIVGGDDLDIRVTLDPRSHVLATTPGAGKWYRSASELARQHLKFDLATDSVLEWLPQETIVYDGAKARMHTQLRLAGSSRYFGWEVLCLGRRASGESFRNGLLDLRTRISTDSGPLWFEQGQLAGSDPMLEAAAGMAGKSVVATILAAGLAPDASLLGACRAVAVPESDALTGVTWMPQLLVGRYLGHSAEAARGWMMALWQQLRPAIAGREACTPRIWTT